MTSFESCLKGRKIRVSDDEFKEMVDLVDLDHLLAQARAAIQGLTAPVVDQEDPK